jgi:hypothetical protein
MAAGWLLMFMYTVFMLGRVNLVEHRTYLTAVWFLSFKLFFLFNFLYFLYLLNFYKGGWILDWIFDFIPSSKKLNEISVRQLFCLRNSYKLHCWTEIWFIFMKMGWYWKYLFEIDNLILKISKFQNEFIKSSFLPKYEPESVRISALHGATIHFWFIFWEKRWLHKFILKFTDLYLILWT